MLIKCPECSKEISDKASSCPNCGCPIEIIKNESNMNDKETENIDFNAVEFNKKEDIFSSIPSNKSINNKKIVNIPKEYMPFGARI